MHDAASGSEKMPLETIDFTNFDPATVRAEAEGRLSRKMLYIYRAFNALAQEKYAQRGYVGLSAAHTSLMANLEKDGLRIVDLAARMGITKQFAGRIVQELIKLDFVTTTPDRHDRRAILVRGTPAGWQYLLDACEVQLEIEAVFKSVLGEDRFLSLAAMIDQLAHLNIDVIDTPEPIDLLMNTNQG